MHQSPRLRRSLPPHQHQPPPLHQHRLPPLHQHRFPLLHQRRFPPLHQRRFPPLRQHRFPPLRQHRFPPLRQHPSRNRGLGSETVTDGVPASAFRLLAASSDQSRHPAAETPSLWVRCDARGETDLWIDWDVEVGPNPTVSFRHLSAEVKEDWYPSRDGLTTFADDPLTKVFGILRGECFLLS